MHGPESIPVAETHRTTIADVVAVSATESPIRTSIAQGDMHAASSMCQELYAEAVGRYCMAALGDLVMARQVILDIGGDCAEQLQNADATRTIRSLLLGLARRRCACLLETNQIHPDAAARCHDGADARQPVAQNLTLPEVARRLLSRLRPSEREVLILRYVCYLTYSEIGGLWEIGESDARMRVSQALAHATALSTGEEPHHG